MTRTRTLIIGNGGSGKTFLARKLAERCQVPVVHLDNIRWGPSSYGVARSNEVVVDDVRKLSDADSWIMEGVYGWLAAVALPRVTEMIWIDLPVDECLRNIQARGIQGNGTDEAFLDLLKWVEEYSTRRDANSYAAHRHFFELFSGPKTHIKNRKDMAAHLAKNRENFVIRERS